MGEVVYISPWGETFDKDEDDIMFDLLEINAYSGYASYDDIWGWPQDYLDYYSSRDDYDRDKYYNDIEERYYRYEWEPPEDTITHNKILVPFINKVFPNIIENTPNEFIYKFIKFSLNNKYSTLNFDLKNHRWFIDLVLVIDTFIEVASNRLPNNIICRILLGNNYTKFIN